MPQAGPDALAFRTSRPLGAAGSSRVGMSRLGRVGGGADAEVSSSAARGAGVRVSVTAMSQLVRVAGLAVRTPGTGRQTASPFPRSPVHSRRRVFIHTITSVLLLPGVFCPLTSATGWDRRPIQATGCPRHDPQRTPRTHGPPERAWSCGLTHVDPVRLRLADPPSLTGL